MILERFAYMLFCCPQCQRQEEIILDRNPCCRRCKVEMAPPSDYSQVWMSPYTAIVRMNTISESCGIDRARTDGRFKKEREAWAAAVLALALTTLKDDVWWVEVETVDATPDTRLRQIDQTPDGNIINTRNIENVDWVENVDDIMTVIRNKCSRAYPRDYFLLVHARNYGKAINFDRDRTDKGRAVAVPGSVGDRVRWLGRPESGSRVTGASSG